MSFVASSLDVTHLKDDFWVVAVVNNPERYKRRTQLFHEYIARMKRYGVNLCVVEIAYGERNFETDDIDVPIKIQLRSNTVLWHKENMINIGISRLPPTWKYVAWIDCDVDFTRPDWVEETIHELQHYSVVQLFEDAVDMGPDHQIINTAKSFMYCYKNRIPRSNKKVLRNGKVISNDNAGSGSMPDDYYYSYQSNGTYWHPGYAWAARREAIDTMGGLLDFAIVGAADHHMACCLIGQGDHSIPEGIHPNYRKLVKSWEERALKINKNVSFIKGTLYHFWHGKKRDRKYKERWQVLIDNKYDPTHHIHKDWQGVLTVYPGHEELCDDIRGYFKARNEDSIDMA